MRSEAPRAKAMRAIRSLMEADNIAPGDPLPSERVLARQLKVSRTTLRWALAALEAEGLIGARGSKTRVASNAVYDRDPLLEDAIVVLSHRAIAAAVDYHDPALMGSSEAIVRGSLQAVVDAGYHTFLLHPGVLNEAVIERVLRGKPRGIVLLWLPTEGADRLLSLFKNAGVPTVAFGGDPSLQHLDRVDTDHEFGAHALTRWLIDRGRRRILQVWKAPATDHWFPPRLAGYQRAMREAGLSPRDPVLFRTYIANAPETAEVFESQARACVSNLVDHLIGPDAVDAIMVPSDGYSYAVAAACKLCGKQPGRDVLIAGYDNYWDNCRERQFESAIPAVTVDKRNFEMGTLLVDVLKDRIAGQLPEGPVYRQIEPILVEPVASSVAS